MNKPEVDDFVGSPEILECIHDFFCSPDELSLQNLPALIRQIPDPVLVHRFSGEIVFQNDAAKELFDPAIHPMKSKITDHKFYLESIKTCESASLQKIDLIVKKNHYELRYRVSLKAGFWEAEQSVFAIFKQNEERNSVANWKVTDENLAFYTAMFGNVSDAVFLNDHEAHFLYANPSGCNLLGYSFSELQQLTISDLILKNNLEEIPLRLNELQEENILILERELIRGDGTVFRAEITVTMIPGGLIQGIVRNLSEANCLASQLDEAKEKATENERLKTAFLQNISHEIRSPLNAIIGFSDLLPEYFGDEEKLAKFTDIIKRKGLDLVDILDDILDISRIESGQMMLEPEDCRMADFFNGIESFCSEYKDRIEKNNILFKLIAAPEIRSMELKIDHRKLRKVIQNLISNSLKFTSVGKIALECKVNKPGEFIFRISDTGIGIPKEIQSEIFSRFTKLNSDSSRLFGGTGIGLSIVQGLLKLIGGTIWLDQECKNGSTFYFTVPFQVKSVPKIGCEPTGEIAKNTHSQFKVLLVEDDYYTSEYLTEVFSESDIPHVLVKSGMKAVETCADGGIALMIINPRLKESNAFTTIIQVKKMFPETEIIALTTYANDQEKQRVMSAGCVDYLSSPIRQEVLLAKITARLQNFSGSVQFD